MALLYPLDHIRARLQTQVKRRRLSTIQRLEMQMREGEADSPKFDGFADCARHVLKYEGWQALYRGLVSGIVGVGWSCGVYFWWYWLFKRLILVRSGGTHLSPGENTVTAAAAGVVNVFITLPIWVVNTRITTKARHEKQSIMACVMDIIESEGLCGLYNGLPASLILCSNPAIQFVLYEQLSRFFRTSGRLHAHHVFLIGALAKAIATVFTYPLQVIKTRLQSRAGNYSGIWNAVGTMYKEDGCAGFFQGVRTKLTQTVLNSAFMFLFYEKIFVVTLNLARTLPKRIK